MGRCISATLYSAVQGVFLGILLGSNSYLMLAPKGGSIRTDRLLSDSIHY